MDVGCARLIRNLINRRWYGAAEHVIDEKANTLGKPSTITSQKLRPLRMMYDGSSEAQHEHRSCTSAVNMWTSCDRNTKSPCGQNCFSRENANDDGALSPRRCSSHAFAKLLILSPDPRQSVHLGTANPCVLDPGEYLLNPSSRVLAPSRYLLGKDPQTQIPNPIICS